MKDIKTLAAAAGIDVDSDTLCRHEGWEEPMARFAALVLEEAAKACENIGFTTATAHDCADELRALAKNFPIDQKAERPS